MVQKRDIEKAAELLSQDQLVAIPTETVYGLGGNALSDTAVAAIYAAKGRPQFNPLIVHVLDVDAAARYVEVTPQAELLAKHFWPGPLTMVLPRRKDSTLSLLLSAGLDSVAVRSPAHPIARELLAAIDFPLAAPSANRSGHVSPTEAQHVRDEFGDKITILDGGSCAVGIESTVIDLTAEMPTILRPGAVTEAQLSAVLGSLGKSGTQIKAPGMLESHYAPNKPIRINADNVKSNEALLAFGEPLEGTQITQNLSATENLQEAAANLFRMMRMLDASAAEAIAVMPIPDEGLGIAINDRLKRAAAPKSV